MKIKLQPFTTPNWVIGQMPIRPRQEGMIDPPKWELCEVDADELSEMCDAFRAEIFQKAKKGDPRLIVGSNYSSLAHTEEPTP